jgi:hypothetical protein
VKAAEYARTSELLGYLLGAALYLLYLVLTKLFRQSPTTEMMICRKPASEAGFRSEMRRDRGRSIQAER